MPSVHALALFALATIAILIVPGPAVLFIVARSVDQGRSAGLVSVLGIHCGTVVHVLAAALGISAVLAASQTAFDAIRYAGAAYLIVLGVRTLLRRRGGEAAVQPVRAPLRRIFAQGMVVNVLNPKTTLFIVAFLPQFVDPARGSATFQILVLGGVFIALGLVSDSTYALGAARAGARLRAWSRFGAVQRYASGAVYIGLGLAAALTGSRPQRS
jgi:threonine/homoserine/homoserine lactone efflux protein